MQRNWPCKAPFFVTSGRFMKTHWKDNHQITNKKLVIYVAGRVFAFYRLDTSAARLILSNA
jgi:hypothetical protein